MMARRARQDLVTYSHLEEILARFPEINKVFQAKVRLLGIPYKDGREVKRHDVVCDLFELLNEALRYQKVDLGILMQAPVVLAIYPEDEKDPRGRPIFNAWIFVNVYHRVCALVLDFSPHAILKKAEEISEGENHDLVNELYRAVIAAADSSQAKLFSWQSILVERLCFDFSDENVVLASYASGVYQDSAGLLAVARGSKSIWDVDVVINNLRLTWEMVYPGA